MVTDLIFGLLGGLFSFIFSLIPSFEFIDSLIQAKEEFIAFISSFMPYTLYLFNVPVLRFSVNLLIAYLTFVALEYSIKLSIKYFTNVF